MEAVAAVEPLPRQQLALRLRLAPPLGAGLLDAALVELGVVVAAALRVLEVHDGALVLVQLQAAQRPRGVGPRLVRAELDGLVRRDERLGKAAGRHERLGLAAERGVALRVDGEALAEGGHGLLEVVQAAQREALVVQRVDVVPLDRQRHVEALEREVVALLAHVERAAVVVQAEHRALVGLGRIDGRVHRQGALKVAAAEAPVALLDEVVRVHDERRPQARGGQLVAWI